MKKQNVFNVLIILLVLISSTAWGQNNNTFTLNPGESKVVIKGTSNVHDWEMNATNFSSELNMVFNQQEFENFEDASFTLRTENIQAESSIMTSKAWDALKHKEYQEIWFELAKINHLQKTSEDAFRGIAEGTLFIAGVKNNIQIDFTGRIKSSGAVQIEAQKLIKMPNYNIKPPTAMFGSLKTGEQVDIQFDLTYQPAFLSSGE